MSVRRTCKQLVSDRSGASAAEFALCLPLFAALLMGVFEFGWTQHCLSTTRFGLERAGRHLSVHPDSTESELRNIVEANMGNLSGNLVSVTLTREARGPTGETGVLNAVYARDVGIPGLATILVQYEASIETPISQFGGA